MYNTALYAHNLNVGNKENGLEWLKLNSLIERFNKGVHSRLDADNAHSGYSVLVNK